MQEMEIITIVSENGFSQNSYLCFNNDSMFLIDCGCTKEAYISALNDLSLQGRRLDGILLTHTHFDHITGLFDVWDVYKCDVYIAKGCLDFIYDKFKNVSAHFGGFVSQPIYVECIKSVEDNQLINVGGVDIVAYLTKGHSMCSLCYKIGDVLFTGDTILEGTVGRCDLYGGSQIELEKSLLKINKLPIRIAYPGHGVPMDKTLIDGVINMYI